jgi:hypothetical protein
MLNPWLFHNADTPEYRPGMRKSLYYPRFSISGTVAPGSWQGNRMNAVAGWPTSIPAMAFARNASRNGQDDPKRQEGSVIRTGSLLSPLRQTRQHTQ